MIALPLIYSGQAFRRWCCKAMAIGRTVKKFKNGIASNRDFYAGDQDSHCHIIKKNAAGQITAQAAFNNIRYGVFAMEQFHAVRNDA